MASTSGLPQNCPADETGDNEILVVIPIHIRDGGGTGGRVHQARRGLRKGAVVVLEVERRRGAARAHNRHHAQHATEPGAVRA